MLCAQQLAIAAALITTAAASRGDNSNEYRGCFHVCHFNNCTAAHHIEAFYAAQPLAEKLLWWTCEDDCRYKCMWQTVEIFMNRDWPIPQFFGKWPFVRWMGMQEPAAVVFSLLNLLAHGFNISRFRSEVPVTAPLYWFWHIYALICINAWTWSVIFHARDTPWTERMDYFCAFSMVVFSLYALCIRVLGPRRARVKRVVKLICLAYFGWHVWYLSHVSFDYSYNMKANVIVGLVNGFGWLAWAWPRWKTRAYVQWCVSTIVCVAASMILELGDFPPLFWTLDAHALWHLSTAPLPFLWYRFLINDCCFMMDKPRSTDFKKHI